MKFSNIRPEKEKEFLEWFEWTNNEFKKFEGFISRKLVKSKTDHNSYAMIVELEDEKVHANIHASPFHKSAIEKLNKVVGEQPQREFFDLVQG